MNRIWERKHDTTCVLGKSMAKLYWRIKKNGKWNWVALNDENTHQVDNLLLYMEGDCECRDCE